VAAVGKQAVVLGLNHEASRPDVIREEEHFPKCDLAFRTRYRLAFMSVQSSEWFLQCASQALLNDVDEDGHLEHDEYDVREQLLPR
jgi:hypothetical protein